MYTSHKIHTHNKCLAILELIQKVNNRLEIIRGQIHLYDNSKWDHPIRLFNNRREDFTDSQEYYQKVKERLVRYYYRTFKTLIPTELEAPTLFTQKTEE